MQAVDDDGRGVLRVAVVTQSNIQSIMESTWSLLLFSLHAFAITSREKLEKGGLPALYFCDANGQHARVVYKLPFPGRIRVFRSTVLLDCPVEVVDPETKVYKMDSY